MSAGERASAVLRHAADAAAELEAAGFTVAVAELRVAITGPDADATDDEIETRHRRHLTPALLDDVARLRAEGRTVREISEQYGTSLRNASRWVAAAAARNGSSS